MSPRISDARLAAGSVLPDSELGTLVDTLQVGVVIHDAQGTIEFVNEAALRMLGLSEGELLGKQAADPQWQVIREDGTEMPLAERPSEKARTQGIASHNLMLGVRRPSMRDVAWLLVNSTPILGADGRVQRVLSSFVNVTERKVAEAQRDAAHAEAALFRNALDEVPAFVYVKDRDSRYVYANQPTLALFGVTAEQLKGMGDREFFPPETVAHLRALDLRVLAGERTREHVEVRQPDGTSRHYLELKVPLPGADLGAPATGLLGISVDVSNQHQSQDRAERIGAFYHALAQSLESIALGASELDLFRAICRAAVDVAGVKMAWIGVADAESRRITPVTSVGDDQRYLDGLVISTDPEDPRSHGPTGEAFRTGRPYWLEDFQASAATIPWQEKAKSSGWVSSAAVPLFRRGQPVGVLTMYATDTHSFTSDARQLLSDLARGLGIALDRFASLEEQRHAEQALRDSHGQFQQLFDGMLSGVLLCEVILDAHGIPVDHRYIRTNRAFSELTGLSAESVIGRTGAEQPLGLLPDLLPQLYQVAMTGEPIQYERFNDQFRRHFESRVFSPTRGQFAISFTDVSERRALEDQLRHSQKMESVGRLAGGVAHDFNNMLSVILGHAELALAQIDARSSLYDDLLEIQSAAQRSADLTRRLLAFARKQSVSPKVMDLSVEVSHSLKLMKRLLREDIPLETELAEGLWPVFIDPTQLDQVLANLCVNARDAIRAARTAPSHDGTADQVRILTANRRLDRAFCAAHGDAPEGDYVLLSVRDTGSGMTPEVRSHIFEPFFTTKPAGEGTGLGLATVFGAVRQAGGFIAVTTAEGVGTTFDVYLPRETHHEPDETTALLTLPKGSGETILVVEDDPAVLQMTTLTLKRLGYEVLAAAGAEQAFELFNAHAGQIDMLLTDVIMPRMNGRQLVEALHARVPTLPYLYMSGYTADVLAQSEGDVNEAHLIQKPFTLQSLAERVRETLDLR